MTTIYKIVTADLWQAAVADGVFRGAPVDLADGYIHFSTADQVKETTAKYFAGQPNLLLVAFDDATLGGQLRYEPSRGGALFPHLYSDLDPRLALSAVALPLEADGRHRFPELAP